jgi:hypothetical protein
MYRIVSASRRRREVWWREPGHVGRWAQKRDRDRRMARCDWARGIPSPRGAGGISSERSLLATCAWRCPQPRFSLRRALILTSRFVDGDPRGGRQADTNATRP